MNDLTPTRTAGSQPAEAELGAMNWLRGELDARWFEPVTDAARLAQALALFLPRG